MNWIAIRAWLKSLTEQIKSGSLNRAAVDTVLTHATGEDLSTLTAIAFGTASDAHDAAMGEVEDAHDARNVAKKRVKDAHSKAVLTKVNLAHVSKAANDLGLTPGAMKKKAAAYRRRRTLNMKQSNEPKQ